MGGRGGQPGLTARSTKHEEGCLSLLYQGITLVGFLMACVLMDEGKGTLKFRSACNSRAFVPFDAVWCVLYCTYVQSGYFVWPPAVERDSTVWTE